MARFTSDTPFTLTGPLRAPAQMLADQSYGGHASVHDDDAAAALGLADGQIEGPTHFSQLDPLLATPWGDHWFSHGGWYPGGTGHDRLRPASDGHERPLGHQSSGNGLADTAAGAGNHYRPPVERSHGHLPSSTRSLPLRRET